MSSSHGFQGNFKNNGIASEPLDAKVGLTQGPE